MRTKGNQDLIRSIIAAQGLRIEDQTTTGNFTSYKLRRVAPALQIVPAGDSYYFNGVYKGKKAWRYSFQNCHHTSFTIDKKAPDTTILGNAAWYDLITAILSTGARVDMLGQKFESVTQYHSFVENCVLYDLVQAEKEINQEVSK